MTQFVHHPRAGRSGRRRRGLTRSSAPRPARSSPPPSSSRSASATAPAAPSCSTAGRAFAGRVGNLPPWVALPSALGTASLITALLGMYWDISLHIDNGRDAGPLANPAHYLILFGLFGIFAAGFLAMTIPRGEAVPDRDPALRRLVRAARRPADGGRGRLRADRLPARRPLAPAVRPGRDAVGPDPPDADRRRLGVADRPGRAARRGHAHPGHPPRRGPRRPRAVLAHAPARRAGRRLPDRALDLPGRVRLRRAAVRLPLPADADRARREHRARVRPPVGRPRRRAGRRRVLPRRARLRVADGRRACGARARRTSRSTSPRRCSSRAPARCC